MAASASKAKESENMQDMTNTNLNKVIGGLDRPQLLKMMGLDFDVPMASDIRQLRPISLHVKRQMAVHQSLVPFLNTGTATECCSGAVMRRFENHTLVIPCFDTEFNTDDVFYKHCTQVCAHEDENGDYV